MQNIKMKKNPINNNVKLSVVIPCYNEKFTIEKIISKISKLQINIEIIVVDDYSTDGSREIIKKIKNRLIKKKIFHKKNYGKGYAIKSSVKFIKGDFIIIQDADLEYSPKDYKNLLRPVLDGRCEVVYGSRVLGKSRYKLNNFISVFRIFANHLLTIVSNVINRQNLTDAHTCYKLFKTSIFKKINLKEKGFSFCPEVTTKISNMNISIIEVPISYNGRDYKEGKKIKFKDAVEAIITLVKYKFIKKLI